MSDTSRRSLHLTLWNISPLPEFAGQRAHVGWIGASKVRASYWYRSTFQPMIEPRNSTTIESEHPRSVDEPPRGPANRGLVDSPPLAECRLSLLMFAVRPSMVCPESERTGR
jgi:hypothetical protein